MTPTIIRRAGIAGAARSSGPTLVIDTFRAFTTAAYLLDAGVDRLLLVDGLDEARRLAGRHPGTLLCGEDEGIKPDDFDLGNSPSQVIERTDLADSSVVMRTSAGTRSVVAATDAGAAPVFAASLVVASATARAVADSPAVTIVAAGLNGVEPADEDDATAAMLEALLTEREHDPAAMVEALRSGTGAERLLTTPSIDDRDLELCLAVDALEFALKASPEGGLLLLTRD
jgi:2-phosphosulfolactate phosphatase